MGFQKIILVSLNLNEMDDFFLFENFKKKIQLTI